MSGIRAAGGGAIWTAVVPDEVNGTTESTATITSAEFARAPLGMASGLDSGMDSAAGPFAPAAPDASPGASPSNVSISRCSISTRSSADHDGRFADKSRAGAGGGHQGGRFERGILAAREMLLDQRVKQGGAPRNFRGRFLINGTHNQQIGHITLGLAEGCPVCRARGVRWGNRWGLRRKVAEARQPGRVLGGTFSIRDRHP
jgi:hypothetical protein